MLPEDEKRSLLEALERLREALDDAQDELRWRDELLSIVAHEPWNPLTPLVFSTDLLLKQAESGQLPTILANQTCFHQARSSGASSTTRSSRSRTTG